MNSVIDPKTGDHPIFFGPMFLHDNSDFESYANFFHQICNLAGSDTSNIVIGSDEERSCERYHSCFLDATPTYVPDISRKTQKAAY